MPRLTDQHLAILKKYNKQESLTLAEKAIFPQNPESLEFESLDQSQFIELANLLEENQAVKKITLASKETLGQAACEALARMLKTNSRITGLNLQVTAINSKGFISLGEAIAASQLTDFSFGIERYPYQDEDVLFKTLAKLTSLTSLQLPFKIIDDLAQPLERILKNNPNLERLIISGDIEPNVIKSIANYLAKNHTLQTFIIKNVSLLNDTAIDFLRGFIGNENLSTFNIQFIENNRAKPAIKETIAFLQNRNKQYKAAQDLFDFLNTQHFVEARKAIANFEDYLSFYTAKMLSLDVQNCWDEAVFAQHANMVAKLKANLIAKYKAKWDSQYNTVLNFLDANDFIKARTAIKEFAKCYAEYKGCLDYFKVNDILAASDGEQLEKHNFLNQKFDQHLTVCEKLASVPELNCLQNAKGVYLETFVAVIQELLNQTQDSQRQASFKQIILATSMAEFTPIFQALCQDSEVKKALVKKFGTDHIIIFEHFIACHANFPLAALKKCLSLDAALREYRALAIERKSKNMPSINVNGQAVAQNTVELTPAAEVSQEECNWQSRLLALAKTDLVKEGIIPAIVLKVASIPPKPPLNLSSAATTTTTILALTSPGVATSSGLGDKTDEGKSALPLPQVKPLAKLTKPWLPAWLKWTLIALGLFLGGALLVSGIGLIIAYAMMPHWLFTITALLSLNLPVLLPIGIIATVMGSLLTLGSSAWLGYQIYSQNPVIAKTTVLETPLSDLTPKLHDEKGQLPRHTVHPANLFTLTDTSLPRNNTVASTPLSSLTSMPT